MNGCRRAYEILLKGNVFLDSEDLLDVAKEVLGEKLALIGLPPQKAKLVEGVLQGFLIQITREVRSRSGSGFQPPSSTS